MRHILVMSKPIGLDLSIPWVCKNAQVFNTIDLGDCFNTILKSVVDIENFSEAGDRNDFNNDKKQNIYQMIKDKFTENKGNI